MVMLDPALGLIAMLTTVVCLATLTISRRVCLPEY